MIDNPYDPIKVTKELRKYFPTSHGKAREGFFEESITINKLCFTEDELNSLLKDFRLISGHVQLLGYYASNYFLKIKKQKNLQYVIENLRKSSLNVDEREYIVRSYRENNSALVDFNLLHLFQIDGSPELLSLAIDDEAARELDHIITALNLDKFRHLTGLGATSNTVLNLMLLDLVQQKIMETAVSFFLSYNLKVDTYMYELEDYIVDDDSLLYIKMLASHGLAKLYPQHYDQWTSNSLLESHPAEDDDALKLVAWCLAVKYFFVSLEDNFAFLDSENVENLRECYNSILGSMRDVDPLLWQKFE